MLTDDKKQSRYVYSRTQPHARTTYECVRMNMGKYAKFVQNRNNYSVRMEVYDGKKGLWNWNILFLSWYVSLP